MSWDPGGGFSTPPLVRNPRLTIRCEYPDTPLEPTEVTFGLSPRYGIHIHHHPSLTEVPEAELRSLIAERALHSAREFLREPH